MKGLPALNTILVLSTSVVTGREQAYPPSLALASELESEHEAGAR